MTGDIANGHSCLGVVRSSCTVELKQFGLWIADRNDAYHHLGGLSFTQRGYVVRWDTTFWL